MSQLYFEASMDATRLLKEVDKISARLGSLPSAAEKSANKMDATFRRAATAIGGYFSLQMFGRATAGIYNFQKEYESAMTEVGTISDEIFGRFPYYQQQVLSLSTKGSQGPKELANSLYQIVSAGYDGAEGLNILEVAAKSATAGFSETKTTADGITTVLNAWGKPFTDAAAVSDTFFKTVERGKTTIPELTSNIAQIAPIASALKIPFEEVMGLMAAITKQGTPTAMAATQIRSAIVGIAQEYGDTAFQGRNLIDTFQFVAEESNHSIDAISKAVGRIEGANAILATTGEKLKFAYEEMGIVSTQSLGATEKALVKVEATTADIVAKLRNNIMAELQPLGESISSTIGSIGKELNEAFKNGTVQEFLADFSNAIKIGSALLITYKAQLIASKVAMIGNIGTTKLLGTAKKILSMDEAILNRWIRINTVAHGRYSLATIAATLKTQGLTAATRALWGAMATNPITAIVAVLGLATAAYFAFRKEVKSAADVQEDFNRLHEQFKDFKASGDIENMTKRYEELKSKQELSNEEQAEFNKLVGALSKKVPEAIEHMDEYGNAIGLSTEKLREFNDAQKKSLLIGAEEGLKVAEKSLAEEEKKLETAIKGMKDSEKVKGTYGGYALDFDDTKSGSQKLAARTDFEAANKEIAIQTENIIKYKNEIDAVKNFDFYKEHAAMFANVKDLTEEEIYNMQNSLEQLYDIAPSDIAKEKISSQIESLYSQMIQQMNSTSEEEGNSPIGFDKDAYVKSLKEAKSAFDEYESLQEDSTKKRYAKENSYVSDNLTTFSDYLQSKYDAAKSYNEKMIIESVATAEEYELNLRNRRPDVLDKLDTKKASGVSGLDWEGSSMADADNALKLLNEKLYEERDAARRNDLKKEIAHWKDVQREIEGFVETASPKYEELFKDAKFSRLKEYKDLKKQLKDTITLEQERLEKLQQSNASEDQIAAQKELQIELTERLNDVEEESIQKMGEYVGIVGNAMDQLKGGFDEIFTEENFGDLATGEGSEMIDKVTEYVSLQVDAASAMISAMASGDIGGVIEAQMSIWIFQAKELFNVMSKIGEGAHGFDDQLAKVEQAISDSDKFLSQSARKGGQAAAFKQKADLLKDEIILNEKASDAEKKRSGSFLGITWDASRSDVIKEFSDAAKQAGEDLDVLNQEYIDFMTGGLTENTLADGIANALKSSEDPVSAFGDFLDNTLRDAIMNNISQQILGESLTKATEVLALGLEDGQLDKDEVAAFKNETEVVFSQAQQIMSVYKDTMPDLFSNFEKAKAGLSGSIQNIKESTANILTGQVNSIIMNMNKSIDLQVQMAASLSNIDRNTDHLDAIDRNIESMSDNISSMAQAGGDRAFGNV